jgi:hypothetical protein
VGINIRQSDTVDIDAHLMLLPAQKKGGVIDRARRSPDQFCGCNYSFKRYWRTLFPFHGIKRFPPSNALFVRRV